MIPGGYNPEEQNLAQVQIESDMYYLVNRLGWLMNKLSQNDKYVFGESEYHQLRQLYFSCLIHAQTIVDVKPEMYVLGDRPSMMVDKVNELVKMLKQARLYVVGTSMAPSIPKKKFVHVV